MLTGRYWLTPEGVQDVSQWGTEHGQIAKQIMLELKEGEGYLMPPQRLFFPITKDDIKLFKKRGVKADVLKFLSEGRDPRLWAMREWNWIRTAGSVFNIWRFDEPTLATIQDAKEYWKNQFQLYGDDKAEIEEASTGNMFSIPVKKLLNRSAEPEALKRTSEGVGRFRNKGNKKKGSR